MNCAEGIPFEPLPAYPELHGRVVDETDSQYIAELERDRTAAAKWAITAAGIVQRDEILRNTTASCISNLRKAGAIL